MTDVEILCCKYALEALEAVGAGLTGKALMDQVERNACRILTTVERKQILKILEDREWAYTYRATTTGLVMYAISDLGRSAMIGL